MSVTADLPGHGHTPAPNAHAPWCSPIEHVSDDGGETEVCFSNALRLDFGQRGTTGAEDTVNEAVIGLVRGTEGRTALTVMAGCGMSLDPDQIRPLAMALLAFDALANLGDLDAFAYYAGQAENGATR